MVLQNREAEDEVSDSGLSDCALGDFQQQEPAPAAVACSGIISANSPKFLLLAGDKDIGTPRKMSALSADDILVISNFLLDFYLKAFII